MKLPLNIHQTVVKFFKPLNEHTFWTVSASAIIGIALYIGVEIGYAELIRQNTFDMHMLSAELLNELGPEYIIESHRHNLMINKYVEHLEQRQGYLAPILRLLYKEYSPSKQFSSTLEALKTASSEDEARKAIWQAGLVSNQLYMRGKRFPKSPIKWFESEDSPSWLLTDIDDAFEEFHNLVDELESAQTLTQKTAVRGCRNTCIASRRIILLISLARLSYDFEKNKEKIECFLKDVKRARNLALRFAKTKEYEENQKLFDDRAKSQNRRIRILEAFFDNDIDRVCNLLTEEVEKALEKQKGNATE